MLTITPIEYSFPINQERSWMGFEAEDYGKLGGMESTSTLFEKAVPVRVTKANAEDRHMDLTARFIMGLSKVHRSTKVLIFCEWFCLPCVFVYYLSA